MKMNSRLSSQSIRQLSTKTMRKVYQLSAIGSKSQCEAKASSFTIRTDTPKEMGGSFLAPQPIELLLASLVGCKTATATFVARHMKPRLNIGKIVFDIEGNGSSHPSFKVIDPAISQLMYQFISSLTTASRDERGSITLPLGSELTHPSRLEYITGTATVHTTKGGSQAQLDSLAHEVEQRCPVANMITMSGCSLSIKWEYAADADAECSSD